MGFRGKSGWGFEDDKGEEGEVVKKGGFDCGRDGGMKEIGVVGENGDSIHSYSLMVTDNGHG